MKTFNLIKTKNGENSGNVQSVFYGNGISDLSMLKEAESYLKAWLEGYNNSLTDEEITELLSGFDGNLSYDVWNFELEEA